MHRHFQVFNDKCSLVENVKYPCRGTTIQDELGSIQTNAVQLNLVVGVTLNSML